MFRASPKSKRAMYPSKNKCTLGRQSGFDKENSKSIHEIGSNFRTKKLWPQSCMLSNDAYTVLLYK